jgi:2,5-dihydroxypyridine 5,6-dioxygenase
MPILGWKLPTVTRGIGGAVPTLVRPSPTLDAIVRLLCDADFVVDLLHERMTHLPIRKEILAAGTRIQTISEPPEMLERMMCTDEIRAEVMAMYERFASAGTLRLLSASGTDVEYSFSDERPALYNYGVADAPGRWENWPTALVTRYPEPGRANGTAVIARGDIIFPLRRYASEDIRMEVEDGFVKSIDGGYEADLIADFLNSWENPNAWAASHLSVGMHPHAWWHGMEFYDRSEILGMDGRSSRGCFLFTTGPDVTGSAPTSNRYVEAHMDYSLRKCTVLLDGKPVVQDGEIVLDAPTDGAVSPSSADSPVTSV